MAATIDIISGNSVKHQAVYESGSVRHFELMTEDYVRLVFKSAENFAISIGDRITVDGKTYVVTTLQKPTFNKNTGGYDYDVRFDAYYWLYNNKIFKFEPATLRNEASFSLTDTLEHHMDIVVRNLAACGFVCTYDGLSGVADAEKHIYIYYDGLHIIDAITHICETFHCEWWIEGNIIHLGKAQRNDAPVRFEVGVNVEDMGSEKGNRELVTRLYAFGSTRNIPFDYRKNDAQVLLNGVVQKRLMLPEGTPYIQIQTVSDEQAVEGMVFFDDIYPKMDNAITSVESRNEEVESEVVSVEGDTEPTTETVPIYRFKDSSLTFRQSYILAGQTLQIQFQSGLLNGMTFDLSFNPDGLAEDILDEHDVQQVNPEAQVFEVVRNDTYGLMLPNDVLKPQVGDEFVLLGWDVRKLEDGLQLITNAEQELKDRADLYMQDLQTDTNVYPCTMMSDYMYGLDGSTQNPAFSKVDAFPLGLPVTLVNNTFFDTGSRLSRVIGWEFKLDKPYDGAIIYVGESATYSSKRATADSIQNVKNDVNYKVSGIGSGMNESQFSILLQAYGAKLFLSKVDADVAGGLITFMHGLQVGVEGIWGYVKEFLEDGVTTVKAWFKNLSADVLQVLDHIKGPLLIKGNTVIAKDDNNQGGSLSVAGDTNINGKLTAANADILNMLTTKNLTVTGLAHFFELVIDKIKAAGGAVLVTPANGFKVEKVESVSGGYKLYWSAEDEGKGSYNMWKTNDQAICQNFNGATVGATHNVSNKYYWSLVTNTSGNTPATVDGRRMHWITISTSVKDGTVNPEEGDEIAMLGYRGTDDASRQSAIYLAAYNSLDSGLTAPLLAFYKGINDFDLTSHRTTYIDANNAVFKGKFLSTSSSQEGIDIESLLSGSEFDIIYGFGNPNTVSPAPHATWTSPALKLLHVGTLYFDLDLEPASEGGRLYRWQKVETGAEYYFDGYAWVAISDIDTLSALDKIADVASDGKLSGGAEKTRVYLQWMDAKKTTISMLAQATENKLDTDNSNYVYKDEGASTEATCGEAVQDLEDSFKALSAYLNNKSSVADWVINGSAIPVWIDPQNTQTGLNVTTELPTWTENSKYSTLSGADVYRRVWDDFYAAVVELNRALNAIQYKNIDEMGDDGLIDKTEKAILRKTFTDEIRSYITLGLEGAAIRSNLTYVENDQTITPQEARNISNAFNAYRTALNRLGTYMDDAVVTEVNGKYYVNAAETDPENDSFTWWTSGNNINHGANQITITAFRESGLLPENIYPIWLAAGHDTEDTPVNDNQWDAFWKEVCDAREALKEAIAVGRNYQVDKLTSKTVYTEFGSTPASADHMTPGVMPSEVPFKVGDRWYEECALVNPVTKAITTQNSDNTQLYNIYVCHTAYTSSSVAYTDKLNYWRLVSKPVAFISEANVEHIYDAIFSDSRFASFELKIDSIEAVVSALGASNNMLMNGDFSEVTSGSSNITHFSSEGLVAKPIRITNDYPEGFTTAAQATIGSAANGKGLRMTTSDQPCLLLKSGRSYTLSAWLKSSESNLKVQVRRGGTASSNSVGDMTVVGGSSSTLTSTWQRFSVTFQGDDYEKAIYLSLLYASTSSNAIGTFLIAGIQLEEGTEVTDWMSGDGNPIVLSSQIKQTATEITAYVKKGTKVGGIKIDSSKVIIYGDSTEIQGDLDVKGLITNAAGRITYESTDFLHNDTLTIPIDLSSVKNIVVKGMNDDPNSALRTRPLIVLPQTESTSVNGKFTLPAVTQSGVMLNITNAMSLVARDWTKIYPYSSNPSAVAAKWSSALIIVSDARLLQKTNYDGGGIDPDVQPHTNGVTSLKNTICCNGSFGKFLAVLPGQTVTLISSIEEYNGSQYLAWYVVNGAEFTRLNCQVVIETYNGNYSNGTHVTDKVCNFWSTDHYDPMQFFGHAALDASATDEMVNILLYSNDWPYRAK